MAKRITTESDVSIHAPAGGATYERELFAEVQAVSIHAPAGGATKWAERYLMAGRVSIHAPAGGATKRGLCLLGGMGFNPRARGGRDCYLYMHLILNTLRTQFREPFLSHLS